MSVISVLVDWVRVVLGDELDIRVLESVLGIPQVAGLLGAKRCPSGPVPVV